eukprot:4451024-Amphidinium_carterae.2
MLTLNFCTPGILPTRQLSLGEADSGRLVHSATSDIDSIRSIYCLLLELHKKARRHAPTLLGEGCLRQASPTSAKLSTLMNGQSASWKKTSCKTIAKGHQHCKQQIHIKGATHGLSSCPTDACSLEDVPLASLACEDCEREGGGVPGGLQQHNLTHLSHPKPCAHIDGENQRLGQAPSSWDTVRTPGHCIAVRIVLAKTTLSLKQYAGDMAYCALLHMFMLFKRPRTLMEGRESG